MLQFQQLWFAEEILMPKGVHDFFSASLDKLVALIMIIKSSVDPPASAPMECKNFGYTSFLKFASYLPRHA